MQVSINFAIAMLGMGIIIGMGIMHMIRMDKFLKNVEKRLEHENRMQMEFATANRQMKDARRRTMPRSDAGAPAVVHIARTNKRPRNS